MNSKSNAGTELARSGEIIAVMVRHGFGTYAQRLGFGGKVETPGGGGPENLRRALEELGPTFVKLGQILSSRPDMLPAAYIAELEKLRDDVAVVPFDRLKQEVEAEHGQPLEEIFAEVDPEPLAAASMAQVHRARMADGEEVVLKIRRPGITARIEADLRLMTRLASLAESTDRDLARHRPVQVVQEFARALRAELDLSEECRNAERVSQAFAEDPTVNVPRVHWQYTSALMNVQSLVRGVKGTDLDAARAAGIDLRRVARNGAEAMMKMIFRDRFFHADPHLGNVFFGEDGALTFIDFGMVGQITAMRRDQLVDLLLAAVDNRPERVASILLDWTDGAPVDRDRLTAEIASLIDRVLGASLGDVDFGALLADVVDMLRENGIVLPSDLSLLLKAFISLEGMGETLDPGFVIAPIVAPFLRDNVLRRYRPDKLLRQARETTLEGMELAAELPGDLRSLLRKLDRGELKFGVDLPAASRIVDRVDTIASRLTLALVIAALIVGSSIVLTASGSELPFGISSFAIVGFIGASLGAFWLLFSILRKR